MSMLNEIRNQDENRDRSLKGRIKDLIPQKGDSAKETVRKIVFLLAVAALVWCVVDAVAFSNRPDLEESKGELSDLYHQATTAPEQNGDTPPVTTPVDSKYPQGMLGQFAGLYDRNPEIIGWLSIPGFADGKGELYIDYPVLQTTNNDFYLNHDFDKKEDKAGALFVDYRNKITPTESSQNTVIYGHNMAAGTYFSHLNDYKKRVSYVEKYRLVNFTTLYEEKQYVIIGCFLTGVKQEQDDIPIFKYHNAHNFDTDEEFNHWYNNLMFRSYYTSDIPADKSDEYITLSTCSTELSNLRWVVVARRVRQGEDPSTYSYYSNPSPRKPALFYTHYGMEIPEIPEKYKPYVTE